MEFSIKQWEDELKEYGIVIKLRPHISKISQQNNDIDMASEQLSKLINETKDDISSVIRKYRISRLLTVNLDVSEIKKSLDTMNEQLKTIDVVTIARYSSLKSSLGGA
jgi:predicted negative regulator of RcsB-dependent stress response